MIKLSIPKIYLPDISATHECRSFVELAQRTRKIAKDGGTSMRGFKMRVNRLLVLMRQGYDITEQLERISDIRPVIHLWQTQKTFREKQPVSPKMLHAFSQFSPKLGTLALAQLLRLYFDKYDLLEEGREPLREYLKQQIVRRDGRLLIGDLKKLAEHQLILLNSQAPQELVKFCLLKQYPLNNLIKQLGIPRGDHNRFISVCVGLYYLETIRQLTPGQASDVFSEVVQHKVYNLPYEDRLLGHAVVEAMIDKFMSSHSDLSDNWRDIILSIAGDPRVPHSHKNFMTWWSVLNHERTQWMQQWLSKIDLELFLTILNEYARNSGNDDIERMFPARARYLEGLYKAGYIKNSRLFLGNKASDYLRKRFTGRALPSYAELSTASKAIIYFKVNNIHCIDGTHSFPLLMFEELPQETPIGDFNDVAFSERSLNQCIIESHEKLIKQGIIKKGHVRIIHHPNLGWQYKAIQAFRDFGIKIDPADVLTRHDFNDYLKKYPI